MKNLKKLTILHSNDLHGDFLAEKVNEKLVGGVSRLSGYINKVRDEEKNVIYVISGDMFRGSLIDSEFHGISTIEIMNLLAPDVVSLGNHEADYGLAHLLFLEKCATFPIINANMYLKLNGVRLFKSHFIKEIDGIRVLFIGILTEKVLASTRRERLIGTLVDIEDAAQEVGKICDAYSDIDIDFTVLLTHIGFEEDKMLAERLNPVWGVDMIIGGHSHTYLTEPCVVAGIPIVQAAIGTDQIGRFDIMVDTDSNCIDSYTWQCVPITDESCPRDEALEAVIGLFQEETDKKYKRVLTRFPRAYTHPERVAETELGDVFAEALRAQLGTDLAILGSGSICVPTLGPIVTLKDFKEAFPYGGPLFRLNITGAQLRHALKHIYREGALLGKEKGSWYQYSIGTYIEYDRATQSLISLKINGKEVQDSDLYSLILQEYHYLNMERYMDLIPEEVEQNGKAIEVASDAPNVLEAYFSSHPLVELKGTPRLIIHGWEGVK